MEILIFAVIAFVIYKIYKSPKRDSSVPSTDVSAPQDNTDHLAKSINQLREVRKQQEERKVEELQSDVTEKRQLLNSNNAEADKMGLRNSLCYIVHETKHWHAWKDNTANFIEKYTDIDDFVFEDAREVKVADRERRFEMDFTFNKKKFQFTYQSRGHFEETNFGSIEVFETTGDSLEKMLKMDTHMTYNDYDVESYTPGDVSLYKIGEWIPMIVSVEAGLQAVSKRVSLEFNKKMLDDKFTQD